MLCNAFRAMESTQMPAAFCYRLQTRTIIQNTNDLIPIPKVSGKEAQYTFGGLSCAYEKYRFVKIMVILQIVKQNVAHRVDIKQNENSK